MKLYKSGFIRNGITVLIGNAGSKGLIYFTNFYLASVLGATNYGSYSYYQNSIMTLVSFALFGLSSSANFFLARDKAQTRLESLTYLSAIFTISTLIFFIITIVYSLWGSNLDFGIASVAYSAIVFAIIQGAMSGKKRFLTNALVNLLAALVFFLSVITITPKSYQTALQTFYNYRFVLFLFGSIWFLYYFRSCSFFSVLVKTVSSQKCKYIEVAKFSLPIAFSSLMVAPVIWFGNHTLINELNGNKELGIYSLGYQVYLILVFIPGVLSNLYLSYLSGQKADSSFIRILFTSLLINIISVALVSLFIHFMLLVFLTDKSSDYIYLKDYVSYFYLSALIYSINSVVGQKYIAKGKTLYSLLFNVTWGLSFLVLVKILVPVYKGEGLAMALFYSYCVQFLVQTFTLSLNKYTKIKSIG
ncbi:oligosaccharide flippase family protein [Vibrio breoganii]